MQKITSVLFAIISLIFINSCEQSKTTSLPQNPLSASDQSNVTTTLVAAPAGTYFTSRSASDSVDLTFTSVSNTTTLMQRRVDLKWVSANDYLYGTFTIKIWTTNASVPVLTQISNRTFTGFETITANGQIIEQWQFSNGVMISETSPYGISGGGGGGSQLPAYIDECTLRTVHNCVASKCNGLGFFETLECASTLGACYAAMWLDCTWELCELGKHMPYGMINIHHKINLPYVD